MDVILCNKSKQIKSEEIHNLCSVNAVIDFFFGI